MKVIIEVNDYVRLENTTEEDQVAIYLHPQSQTGIVSVVNINDLRAALRKMVAK